MSLTLYFHPLSSFCQKVLIALYENDTPFMPRIVDLGDENESAAFRKIWPIGKFPVLRDDARDQTIPESSIIIEYLAQHYPGRTQLIPAESDLARETRMRDRFFDLHVNEPMQKIVTDRRRPAEGKDPYGVEHAQAQLATAYGIIQGEMSGNNPTAKTWAMGDVFSMADCAAAPALFYANKVMPFSDTQPNITAYFDRLMQRPSFMRAVKEARPYLALFRPKLAPLPMQLIHHRQMGVAPAGGGIFA